MTVQTTMLPDGVIEMRFGHHRRWQRGGRRVAGTHREFHAAESERAAAAVWRGAVGERFSEKTELDTVAVARKFYQTHPDNYDQLVIWTDGGVRQDAFAYESTIANEIRGIGLEIFDSRATSAAPAVCRASR